MNWYYNLKISTKLIIGFIVVALIAGFMGVVGIYNIRVIDRDYKLIINDNMIPLGSLAMSQENFQGIRVDLRNILLDSQNKEQYISSIRKAAEGIDKNLAIYAKDISSAKEQETYNEFKVAAEKYSVAREKCIGLVQANQNEQAWGVLKNEAIPPATEANKKLQELFDLNFLQAKERAAVNNALTERTVYVIIGSALLAMFVAVGLGMFIAGIISRPVNRILEAAHSIARGNLDVNLKIDTDDEVGSLGQAFVKIIESLRNLVADSVMLAEAAREGALSTRADVSKHDGDYRKIVEGVNQTLEAIAKPINEVKMVSGRMAMNDYTEKVTGSYKGELYEFAEAVNMVQTRLISAQNVAIKISLGDLSSLDEFIKVGKLCENDKLVPSFIAMMLTIRNLINESNMIADAAINGNLDVRGNVAKFSGEYCDIINGLNKTLDAIGEPIKEATKILGEMADGNLCVEMQGDYKGSYALIKNSLNNTIQSFTELLGNIDEATDQVASGARQVSDGSQALSQGATEQASSVEQLTVSINQVASQTKDNAINANKANELAMEAKENAEAGNQHMRKMLTSMAEINESSSKISKIIKVIDEIAFQTNILALNAAVEAARAGQHGKGFAVVAEEVRNLAARSANAAKETTALIEGSVKNVDDGTKTANGTAKALEDIVVGIAATANLVGDIASASNEQATAIAQINKGVEQVAQVIQTNSATAEESAAASEELSGQADVLKDMIGKFKLQHKMLPSARYEENTYSSSGIHENRRGKLGRNVGNTRGEVVATKSKPRISLSDMEFGKY